MKHVETWVAGRLLEKAIAHQAVVQFAFGSIGRRWVPVEAAHNLVYVARTQLLSLDGFYEDVLDLR